jgi:anti-sigma regulatory factor (Ser/Thr protein kinase)
MTCDQTPLLLGWDLVEQLEILDQAGADEKPFWTEQDAEEYARGLLIITELADAMGHERTHDGHLAWAELAI